MGSLRWNENHSMHSMPHTLEGKIVRLADKIAYINHDIDDSVRAKVLRKKILTERIYGSPWNNISGTDQYDGA